MFSKKYLNEYRNTIYQNNALKITLLALLIIILVEGFFVIKAMNTQRTVIIPSVKGKYVLENRSANVTYLVQMAYFLTGLMENFTPQTVKANYERFLNYVAPSVYGKTQADLLSNAENYISTDTSSYFVPKTVRVYKDSIVVMGNRKLMVADKVVSSLPLKVIINYEIKNGMFEVISYEEKKNNM